MVSEQEERMLDEMELDKLEVEKLKKEYDELDESLSAHTKLLSNWRDEVRMEQEKFIAILRNIVREEAKVDTLTIKVKELEEKIRDKEAKIKQNI